MIDEAGKKITICDITVAFENRREALDRARQTKLAKFLPIIEDFRGGPPSKTPSSSVRWDRGTQRTNVPSACSRCPAATLA